MIFFFSPVRMGTWTLPLSSFRLQVADELPPKPRQSLVPPGRSTQHQMPSIQILIPLLQSTAACFCLPTGSQPESSTLKKPEKMRLESKQFLSIFPLQISTEETVRSELYDLGNPNFPENLKSNGCIWCLNGGFLFLMNLLPFLNYFTHSGPDLLEGV